jgi:hypothetical protein
VREPTAWWRQLTWRVTPRPERWLPIWLNSLTVAYGLWLALPMDTFAGATLYRSMVVLAPEWAWGLATAGPAMVGLWRLLRGRPSAILLSLGAGWWLFLVILAASVNPASGGIPIYSCLAAGYVWCSWWASRAARAVNYE